MKTHNAKNERIKHQYFNFLREAKGQSELSIDLVAKALSRFEAYTKFADFGGFRQEQAVGFKHRLAEQLSQCTGEPLSKATLRSTLNALRNFFRWVADERPFGARATLSSAEYFSLPGKDLRIATTQREREGPTLEQIERVLSSMPNGSDTERRDRAVIAFTILTGARDGAIVSLKLKHVDLDNDVVEQNPNEVHTKASKAITTWFFPVGGSARQIFAEWVEYLRAEKSWGFDDPLFPATRVAQNEKHQFSVVGIERQHWSTTHPIRGVFRSAFKLAGIPYFNPHSFRKTLALLGEKMCQTPEQFKAWSQNLGHEQMLTTFTSYGAVPRQRQGEIIRELGSARRPTRTISDALLRELTDFVSSQHTPPDGDTGPAESSR